MKKIISLLVFLLALPFVFGATTILSDTTSNFTSIKVSNITNTTHLVVTTLNSANCDVKSYTNGSLYCGTDSSPGDLSELQIVNTTMFSNGTIVRSQNTSWFDWQYILRDTSRYDIDNFTTDYNSRVRFTNDNFTALYTSYFDANRTNFMANSSNITCVFNYGLWNCSYSGTIAAATNTWNSSTDIYNALATNFSNLIGNSSNLSWSFDGTRWVGYFNGTITSSSGDMSALQIVNTSMLDNTTIVRSTNTSWFDWQYILRDTSRYDIDNFTSEYNSRVRFTNDNFTALYTSYFDANRTNFMANSSNVTCLFNYGLWNCSFTGTIAETPFSYGALDWYNGTQVNNSIYNKLLSGRNANFTNVNATYLEGQPITGMLGSGIIWANGTNTFAEVNVTCTGLTCSYSAFKVRLINTSNDVTYCDISSGSFVLTDNQHDVLYVDKTCTVKEASIQNYINTPISPGGIADFANIVAYGSDTENVNGIGLENKRIIKLRKLLLETMHLDVISGFDKKTEGTFPYFNISSGKYVYLMDIVQTTDRSSLIQGVEVVSHSGVNTWQHINSSKGLNLTYCDTGSATQACTNTNKYRRIFIFMIGYNDTIDSSTIHQLLPLQSTYYSSITSCLDTVTNPLTYTLPIYYQKSAVMLWAYCITPSDVAWTTNFIDLRTVKQTTATGSIDLSPFLNKDGSVALTANWNIGGFTIYNGGFNGTWNGSVAYALASSLPNITMLQVNSSIDTKLYANISNLMANTSNISCSFNSFKWECYFNGTISSATNTWNSSTDIYNALATNFSNLIGNSSNLSWSFDGTKWYGYFNGTITSSSGDMSALQIVNTSMLDNGTVVRSQNTSWFDWQYILRDSSRYDLDNFTSDYNARTDRFSNTNFSNLAFNGTLLTQSNLTLYLKNSTDANFGNLTVETIDTNKNVTLNGLHIDKLNSSHWKIWG